MKTDAQLKNDVIEELLREPSITSTDIHVATHLGAVTLSGTVPHYAEKQAAERAIRRVEGVAAIAEEMEVHLVGVHARKDSEIAHAVVNSLAWHVWVPSHVQATVESGWVTLTGSVMCEYQRSAAEEALGFLSGIRGIRNKITLESNDELTESAAWTIPGITEVKNNFAVSS